MTKEPSKDFRYAIGVELARFSEHPSLINMDATTDKIIALCKEMLVPEAKYQPEFPWKDANEHMEHWKVAGWNSARQHLLKQLGEK